MRKLYLLIAFFLIQIQGFANLTVNSCERSASLSKEAAIVTPTFNPIGYICVNSPAPTMASVSLNGITGTWSPATINTAVVGAFVHTFTPNPGQNATTATATVHIVASSAVGLVSEDFTDEQTIQVFMPIVPIVYDVTNASLFEISGLPDGVNWQFDNGQITISGIPVQAGAFFYTINVLDGCGFGPPITGYMIATPEPQLLLASPVATTVQTVCVNTPIVSIVYVALNAEEVSFLGLPPGVSGFFANGNVVISGTPTAAGVFNYIVTASGTSSQVAQFGTITVSLNAAIMSSSSNQIVCIGTALSPMTFTIGNGATGAAVTSGAFPPGVSAVFAAGVMTVYGVPAASGTYNYVVSTTGGCDSASQIGTITVNPNVSLALISSPGTSNQTLCADTPISPIIYNAGNGATGAMVVGLPPGVTSAFSGGNVAITGVPTETGMFNYTVITAGGCSSASLSGIIIVNLAANVNLACNGVTGTSVTFDWDNLPGATAYNYSYTIGNGPLVSGMIVAPSLFTVPGVNPGQSVVFMIASVNGGVSCFSPQSITCTTLPLSSREFEAGSFAIYPNPVTDILHIEYDRLLSNVMIFNTLGQQMGNYQLGVNKADVDLSGFAQGIYLVKVAAEEVSETFTIVKK